MGILDAAVSRERDRRDPLGRLPWWARLLGAILIGALAVAQIVLGRGASALLGVLLLVAVVPRQVLSAYAAWVLSRER